MIQAEPCESFAAPAPYRSIGRWVKKSEVLGSGCRRLGSAAIEDDAHRDPIHLESCRSERLNVAGIVDAVGAVVPFGGSLSLRPSQTIPGPTHHRPRLTIKRGSQNVISHHV